MEEKTIGITKEQLVKSVAKVAFILSKTNPFILELGDVFASRLTSELFGEEKEPADDNQYRNAAVNELFNWFKFRPECINEPAEERVVFVKKKEPKYKLSRFEFECLKRFKKSGVFWIYRDEGGSIHVLCYPKKSTGRGDYSTSEQCIYSKHWDVNTIGENDFSFLNWEKDEKATLIDDILNDCEVIDNE